MADVDADALLVERDLRGLLIVFLAGRRRDRELQDRCLDSALREQNGHVNALGLYDLDRNIRNVGTAYKQLIRDWREVLPASSVCLTVPLAAPDSDEPLENTRAAYRR